MACSMCSTYACGVSGGHRLTPQLGMQPEWGPHLLNSWGRALRVGSSSAQGQLRVLGCWDTSPVPLYRFIHPKVGISVTNNLSSDPHSWWPCQRLTPRALSFAGGTQHVSTRRPDASFWREKQIPRNTWNFNLSETRTRVIMKSKRHSVSTGNVKNVS